ncbi:hypothetical protein GG344DRAFT_54217 [Lentinula edodes]|nr:hypothetical protein GG344DRAFT_54217 [Lentinula edodes]
MLVQTSLSPTNLGSGPFSTGAASWTYGTYTENYIGGFNGRHHNDGDYSYSNEHAESSCYPHRGNRDGNRIFFYHKHQPYFEFTNFSRHAVSYEGKMYPTSEHLFQAFKFIDHNPHLAEHIRICSDLPRVALIEAHRLHEKQRSDWREVNVEKMELTLYLKFTQHRQLREKLVSTGNAELVENSDTDSFWGIGPDGRGRNELGKALERLRAYLRGGA